MIESGAGSYFDPRLTPAFCAIVEPLYCETRDVSAAEVELRLPKIIGKYCVAAA